MTKGATALDFSKLRTKAGSRKRSNVNSNYQFPNGCFDEDDDVLPALHDYLALPPAHGTLAQALSNAEAEDILQVFDDYTPAKWQQGRSNGHLTALPPAEQNKVVQLDEYQRNSLEQRRDAQEPVQPTARQAATPYLVPPTNPSQRNQERRATAKLDYYKKLAELQQMNLEFGRSIRAARQEAQQEARNEKHNGGHNGTQHEATNGARKELPHPLTTSFHVATKRTEPRKTTLPTAQPTPHPLPANQQRVTAKLDYNRLLEFQRRYDEAHPNGPSIEDHLANRLVSRPTNTFPTAQPTYRPPVQEAEPTRPRLPVRAWENTPATEALALPGAKSDGATSLEQRQTGKLDRSTLEQLEAQMRQQPAVERVREVLLDPTRIDPHLIALSDFNPRAAKYFDQVAVSLISVSYKRLCKRVLIASAQQGEGRTCVTLNLAGALARARQRVLVVDCDLANPSVLRLLGIDAPLGLSEAVHRGLGPNSAALRVQPAGFNILPTREKIQHTAELLASPRFHEMLQICEPDYDFILFDSSPLLESADANLLAGLTDATMLVIRPGMTTTQQMAKAVALFNEKDICGVVLNRVGG
jgi:Mrp family chromosome partitioning ATPase